MLSQNSHFVSFSVLIAVLGSLKYQTVTGQVAGPTDNFLLVTDSSLNNIYEVSLETGQAFRLFSSRPVGTNPIAVTYDPINKVIYWSDNGDSIRSISKFSLITLTNSTVYVDSTLTAVIDGLTIDPYEQILYYTDAGNSRVGQISTTGTGHRIISAIANSQPRAIIHDKQNSLLYWTDWSSTFPAIYRAPASSGITTTLVSGNLYWPNALAIDFNNGVMYWGDSGLHKIEMANIDGTGRTVLVQSTTARYYGMTLDSLYLYYTDWSLSYIVKMSRQNYVSSIVPSAVSFARLNAIVQYNSTDRNTIGNFNLTSTARPTTTIMTTTTTTPVIPASTTTTTTSAQQLTTIIIPVAAVVSCAVVLIVIVVVIGCVLVHKRRSPTPVPKIPEVVYSVSTTPPPYSVNDYRNNTPPSVVPTDNTYYSIIHDNDAYLTFN